MRRRWAEQRLGELLDDGAGRAALVDLGSRYGIITPVTSLYVPTTREIEEEERSRRRELDLEEVETEEVADNKEGGTGTRAKGEEGSMGRPTSSLTNRRYAVRGPSDNSDPHVARKQALDEAQEFGMIGVLNSGAGGEPEAPAAAPTTAWGRDSAKGGPPAEEKASGNMWGNDIPQADKELAPPPAASAAPAQT